MSDPRCRSGDRCQAKTSDGAACTGKPDTICAACVVDIQRMLDELPHLSAALKCFLGGSMKIAYTSKVQASREPAAPLNIVAADLIDEIGDALDRAGGMDIRTLIQRPAELFVVWSKGGQKKGYLTGVDRALAIRRTHRKASDVVGLHEVWQRRHAPCPNCDKKSLGGFVGRDVIQCTNEDCEIQMDLDTYEQWCHLLKREESNA